MEVSLKEYERGLDLFVDQERNLNRLTFWRTVLLIAAVLFFSSYVGQFEEINGLRRQLALLAPEEKDWTVLGYLNEHEVVEHSVVVPDQQAKALMQLVGKLRSFLGEDVSLENQADQRMGDFLKLADRKPARIRIQNSYLPNLTLPISYSGMALTVFGIGLISFFYFAYRRQTLAELMNYIRKNLRELVPSESQAPLGPDTFSRGLLEDASWSLTSLREALRQLSTLNRPEARTRLRLALLGQRRASPYRLLNNIVAVFLFARLTFLTAHIVLAELGLTVSGLSKGSLVLLLLLAPSICLYLVNHWYLRRVPDPAELLTDQGEF